MLPPVRPAALLAALPAALMGALVLAACNGGPGATERGASGAAPAAPDFPALHEEVCDTIRNSFECARAIEARQLPRSTDVERRGDTLLLHLAGGDTLRLVDRDGDASEVVHYSYQTRWPQAGQMLVQVQYYEGSEYELVDEAAGERTTLPHWPLRRPGGERFAVLSFDLEAGYGPNTLQIWELSGAGPELRWTVEPEDWGPAEGHWEDETTLRFVQRGICEDPASPGRELCDRPARVTLGADGWRMETDG